MNNILPLLRRIRNSISFITMCIALGFGVLALALAFFRPNLLTDYPRLAITDKENIKFILSFTIGGVFTLTIFTFTMVMNVLDRSISNYSPRLIPLILREKKHQIILGVTSGTLLYALVMAIVISSSNNEDFPPMAAPLAILMSMVNIVLFIYFIHSVSQTIQVNFILYKSFKNTRDNLMKLIHTDLEFISNKEEDVWIDTICFEHCGYLNKIRLKKLIGISEKQGISFKLLKTMGSFVMENEPVLAASSKIDSKSINSIKRCISIDRVEAIDVLEIGFKHLVEVAVKASSPAINDPGTALTAIDYLTQLFILRHKLPDAKGMKSATGGVLFFEFVPSAQLAEFCFVEMEAYMEDDPLLMRKLAQSKRSIGQDGISKKMR